jgi:hypothetical protein
MHETRHRYLIVAEAEPPKGARPMSRTARTVWFVVAFLLALFYFVGFFWYGAAPLESEHGDGGGGQAVPVVKG